MNKSKKLIIVGGGAAGVFAAIRAAERGLSVILLEKTDALLSKVLLTGGGRCNLTNATFDLHSFAQNYPRGRKELLSSFSRFSSKDAMDWFEAHGVFLKVEENGRVFPQSGKAKTIVDCLSQELERLQVDVRFGQEIVSIERKKEGFELSLKTGDLLFSDFLLLASGNSSDGHSLAASLGHRIVATVPSLFSFEIDSFALKDLSGVSVDSALVSMKETPFKETGSLLITHFGFSGPSILNLSSWAARFLSERSYQAELLVDWLGSMKKEESFSLLKKLKREKPLTRMGKTALFGLSQRLWKKFLELCRISEDCLMTHLADKSLQLLAEKLTEDLYRIKNRRSDKGEFVLCGGVCLKEVDCKTFESRNVPRLYFAGEILDVDGRTGGFNLQHGWTSGWIAADAMASQK